MPVPRRIRKKLAEEKRKATRETLIANAEKRLPKKLAALYAKQKADRRDER